MFLFLLPFGVSRKINSVLWILSQMQYSKINQYRLTKFPNATLKLQQGAMILCASTRDIRIPVTYFSSTTILSSVLKFTNRTHVSEFSVIHLTKFGAAPTFVPDEVKPQRYVLPLFFEPKRRESGERGEDIDIHSASFKAKIKLSMGTFHIVGFNQGLDLR